MKRFCEEWDRGKRVVLGRKRGNFNFEIPEDARIVLGTFSVRQWKPAGSDRTSAKTLPSKFFE